MDEPMNLDPIVGLTVTRVKQMVAPGALREPLIALELTFHDGSRLVVEPFSWTGDGFLTAGIERD